jgi:hypothetical protein
VLVALKDVERSASPVKFRHWQQITPAYDPISGISKPTGQNLMIFSPVLSRLICNASLILLLITQNRYSRQAVDRGTLLLLLQHPLEKLDF